ncbi:hypothetical protein M406DRAFT_228461, partial [Cryphonectria parasitica EP155]
YSRLHITPLDPALLKVVVPPSVLPHARCVSYHTIQTFPERPYGFIELPSADATKIKNKLNGAVLRGSKIRVELARPDNMPQPSPDAVVDHPSSSKRSRAEKKDRKDRKRKRDPQEIVGIELEEGRKVKRGWTEKKEERKSAKSKDKEKKEKKDKKKKKAREPESLYSEVPECLIKTQLPPNRLDVAENAATDHKKKSKKKQAREIVVHEFERNTKFPTFLKPVAAETTKEAKKETSFIEGKGWVGDDGTVVEEVKSTRPKAFPKIQVNQSRHPKPKETAQEDDTSSSSGDSSSDDESSSEDMSEPFPVSQMSTNKEVISSSLHSPTTVPTATTGPEQARPESSGSLRSLTIKIPPATPTPGSSKVHPLEALYKRQKGDQTANSKSEAVDSGAPFSFFGAHGEDIDSDEDLDGEDNALESDHAAVDSLGVPPPGPPVPMTPFTKQDFEWRNTRSAAPTPDTAHPSRISRFWPLRGEEENVLDDVQEDAREEDGNDEDTAGHHSGAPGDGDEAEKGATNPNTDFQKWFWENRGDLNRSWKKRRKLAAKEKRYRDNKARADRAV